MKLIRSDFFVKNNHVRKESMIWTSWEVMTIAVNFSTQVLLLATANCFSKGWIFETKNTNVCTCPTLHRYCTCNYNYWN